MTHTSTNNHHLFAASRHRQEAQTVTAESSWLTAPREGFTAQQDAKRQRLSDSKEGRLVNGAFILGHVGGRK